MSDERLREVVASIHQSGASSVLVGVVGGGVRRVRRTVGELASVHPLSVPATTALATVATEVFPVPGRCVLVVRAATAGWDMAVAPPGELDDRMVEPPAPSLQPAPPPPRLRLHGGTFARTLVGEVAGAGLGFGAGLALASDCEGSNCNLGWGVLGACAGSWTGSVVGAATARRPVPSALGALVGSGVSFGMLSAAAVSAEHDVLPVVWVSLALLAPPLGAAAGTSAGGPAATVSWRW